MGKFVTTFVVGVAGVTLGVTPLHPRTVDGVEFAPQVLIEDGFLGSSHPATAFPVVNPLGDALAQILTVGDHDDRACVVVRSGGLQAFHGGEDLHAVVRRFSNRATQLADPTVRIVHASRPATGPRISRAGAVAENYHGLFFEQVLLSSRQKGSHSRGDWCGSEGELHYTVWPNRVKDDSCEQRSRMTE
jgi:hypothetical protein